MEYVEKPKMNIIEVVEPFERTWLENLPWNYLRLFTGLQLLDSHSQKKHQSDESRRANGRTT